MTPYSKIHQALLDAVDESAHAVAPALSGTTALIISIEIPSSLDFLEELAGFHVVSYPPGHSSTLPVRFGPPPHPRPRTPAVYSEVAQKFILLRKSLDRASRQIACREDGPETGEGVEKSYSAMLCDSIGVRSSYSLQDLRSRIANCSRSVRAAPMPTFQTRFLLDLPTELLYMSVSYVDDDDVVAVANTCSCMRSICVNLRRLNKRVCLRLRFDSHAASLPYPATRFDLYPEMIEHLATARDRMTGLMRSVSQSEVCVRNTRYLCVDNEWEQMWPPHAPGHDLPLSAIDRLIFEPLYDGIIETIECLPVEHIRLVSMSISDRLLRQFSDHPSLRRLTVDRYSSFPGFILPAISPVAINVTYLAIGFHGSYLTHRTQWRLMGAFPCLRHLYAYTTHVTETDIHYPLPTTEVFGIHTLEVLHIQGSCQEIRELRYWLVSAARSRACSGSLRKLKLYSREPISYHDTHRLIHILGQYHPSLRVLVLEGLDHVPSLLFWSISRSFRDLESLSLVKRANYLQRSNELCSWSDPLAMYAEALQRCHGLRHVEINAQTRTTILDPVVLDGTNDAIDGLEAENRPIAPASSQPEHRLDGAPADAASIAHSFAAHCPSLTSFAIRASVCYFSCTILRSSPSKVSLSDVCCAEQHDRFLEWNPWHHSTWDPPR